MLTFSPQKRASASQMLSHPWLNVRSYDTSKLYYLMNAKDIKKHKTRKNKKTSKSEAIQNLDEIEDNYVEESQSEINQADHEDNSIIDWNEEFDDSFLGNEPEIGESKLELKNFENSFIQYGQFIDLQKFDRANPQFENI